MRIDDSWFDHHPKGKLGCSRHANRRVIWQPQDGIGLGVNTYDACIRLFKRIIRGSSNSDDVQQAAGGAVPCLTTCSASE